MTAAVRRQTIRNYVAKQHSIDDSSRIRRTIFLIVTVNIEKMYIIRVRCVKGNRFSHFVKYKTK